MLEAAETTEGAVAKKINDGSKERHNRREVAYSLDIIMCDRKRKTVIVNRKLFNLLGHRDFTARYLRSPSDDVVVAMALVAGHKDMEKAERDTATVWLDLWDDSSLHFQYLRKRGLERSGSS